VAIQLTDTKSEYIPIREARKMSGLRIVLASFTIPGPWFEACKGVYYVKGLEYARVRNSDEGAADAQIGMGNSQSELFAWTAQSSAPVVAWNDERPRASWIDQLRLAERLAPEPALIPEDYDDRIRMFGLANELLGEDGLVWNKRQRMVTEAFARLPDDSPERGFWEHLGRKYGYSEAAGRRAPGHIAGILEAIGEQLTGQRAKGRRYLIGESLSALDIYWAAVCGILAPMLEDRCPMFEGFREVYGNRDPRIAKRLSEELLAHRDFIYEEHLELPIVF
jgi:glutathione S-transferase